MAQSLRQTATDNAVVGVIFFCTAWAGQTLAFPPFVASVVCPASGVALAATILRGRHVWPGVLAGTFAILLKVLVLDGGASLMAGAACALLVGVAQAVQAYIGGILFKRWVDDPSFGSPAAAFRYASVAAISAAIGSSGAVAALVGFGFIQAEMIPEITVWAVGRTAGMLIFTPAILLCVRNHDYGLLKSRRLEAVLLLCTVLVVTTAVFGLSGNVQRHYPLEYVIFPGLLWALVRFGNRELAVLVAMVSVIATFATAHRLGPFTFSGNPNESLMLMELYFGVMTISSLLGGALAVQRNRALRQLEIAHHNLEERVAQRTQELREANAALQAEINERRLLAKAFEYSVEPALITDPDMSILSVNSAFAAVTGYCPVEIKGKRFDLLVAPDEDRGRYDQLLAELGERDEVKGELRCRHRHDGKVFPSWVSLAVVRNNVGNVTQHIVTLTDLTEQKAAEEHRAFRADHDMLTGLLNRASLEDALQRTIAYARRRRLRFGVLFVDLDHFKPINDTFGHAVGDKTLKAVVERLLNQVRSEDIVARLGGDEFVIVLPEVQDAASVGRVAAAIVEQLSQPFQVDDHELTISSSIGISLFPDDAQAADELLMCADLAMYKAKTSRNAYRFYAAASEALEPKVDPAAAAQHAMDRG